MPGAQAALRAEEIANGSGISGAVADVVGYAVGEALFGVGEGHEYRQETKRRAKARHLQLLVSRSSRELSQEAHIVLKENLNVVDLVFQHGEAVDAHAEGEAADFFGVVVDEAVDGGIDHACTEEFDPAGAFALGADS